VKHLKIIFRTFFLLFAVLLTPQAVEAQVVEARQDERVAYFDSVEVSLLTCQPHDEVYSLYGHTALRWHDLHTAANDGRADQHEMESDIAYNWGIFNFNAPHFVARFVFGLTDYELGPYPYSRFQQEYQYYGSMVTEQVLNLTAAEKMRLKEILDDNMLPENRIYRYNYFYNNCTTKARDVIEQCVSGKIEYSENKDFTPSFRDMVHEMARNHPWARFGNDVLLGIQADQPTTRREQEFLPHHLMHDFDEAQVYENGLYRPLVKERRVSVAPGVQMLEPGFPLSPMQCAIGLTIIGLLIFCLEWIKRKTFVVWDVLLALVSGVIGIVLFLMLFSQHPTVRLNLQFILYNPLHLFFLWPIVRGKKTRYWAIAAILALLFLLGGCWQTYAEGIQCLALCLLLQCILHLFRKCK